MPHECTNCGRAFPDGSKEMLSGCPDCGGNKFRYRPTGGKLDADGVDDRSGSGGSAFGSTAPGPGRDPDGGVTDGPGESRVADTVSKATRNLREWVGVDDDEPVADTTRDSSRSATSRAEAGSGPSDDPPEPGDPAGAEASSRPRSTDREDRPQSSDRDERTQSGDRGARPPVGSGDRPGDPTPDGSLEDQFDPSPPEDAVVEEGGVDAGGEDGAQARARTSMVGPDDLPDDAGDEPTDGSTDDPDGGDGSADEAPDLSQLREELNDQFESIKIVEPGQYELNLMELYDRDEYIISLMEDGRYAIEVPETWRDAGK